MVLTVTEEGRHAAPGVTHQSDYFCHPEACFDHAEALRLSRAPKGHLAFLFIPRHFRQSAKLCGGILYLKYVFTSEWENSLLNPKDSHIGWRAVTPCWGRSALPS